MPTRDSQQDWTLLSASQAGGITTISASRPLTTGDLQDWPVKNLANKEPIKYLAAMGATDSYSYHTHRALGRINFYCDVTSKTRILEGMRLDPNVSVTNFTAQGHYVHPRCQGRGRGLTRPPNMPAMQPPSRYYDDMKKSLQHQENEFCVYRLYHVCSFS